LDLILTSLSIVIPFYNEPENSKKIYELLQKVRIHNTSWILVDNGSTDKITLCNLPILENVTIVRLESNFGFGGGIKEGLKAAESDYVAWMPGNLKVHPLAPRIMLDRFLLSNNFNPDVFIKAEREGRSILAKAKTSISSLSISLLASRKLTDIGGTPTIIQKKYIEKVFKTPNDYVFELATYLIFLELKCEEIRIPNPYLSRIFGKTHWQNGLQSELQLLFKQIKYVMHL
jgi:glycosyltransferase involved in cell wall biosynthesis